MFGRIHVITIPGSLEIVCGVVSSSCDKLRKEMTKHAIGPRRMCQYAFYVSILPPLL